MKTTFLHQMKPLNTCMIQSPNPTHAICLARNGVYDGAEAFGFQYESLEANYHTEADVKSIFRQMGNRPIYVTNYRGHANEGKSDEELVDGLLDLVRWGATMADVMGDFFCPDPLQLTRDPAAVEKQMDVIERIHHAGGEVLMSSHTMKFMSADEVMAIALAHKERGADIAKIVTAANNEDEELENLRTTTILRRELGIPFLFLSAGSHNRFHRTIGPMLGCAMWLTVHEQTPYSTRPQPHTRAIREIEANFDYR